jgi:hypothetical protein
MLGGSQGRVGEATVLAPPHLAGKVVVLVLTTEGEELEATSGVSSRSRREGGRRHVREGVILAPPRPHLVGKVALSMRRPLRGSLKPRWEELKATAEGRKGAAVPDLRGCEGEKRGGLGQWRLRVVLYV